MNSAALRHRMVAPLAAYAVALHALLAALVPAAPAAFADLAILCTHDAGGSPVPAQHDKPCAEMCAALGASLAGPMPPHIVVAIARPRIVLALAPASDWVPPRPSTRGPQSPRAPPV